MKTRITFQEISPKIYAGLQTLDDYFHDMLEPGLIELVKYRVSQINHCAFCLDMHHKEAMYLGEEEIRLHLLPAWRETSIYSLEERAALAFAEALTHPTAFGLSDEVYNDLSQCFGKEEIVALTAVVAHINSWNRINHAFRPVPGKYQVGQFK